MMRCNTIASDYTNKFSGMEDRRTPFNHIYACHNRALGHRNNSATNVTAIALQHSNSENSFNCLKDLMLAHFYLVSRQQSNSIMIKEKLVMTLMIENEQLKAKVKDNSKQLSRKKKNPPPLIPITSTAKRSIPPISAPATAEQCTDLVVTDLRGTDSTFVFETGVNKNTGCSISKPYEFTTTERTGLSNWAQQASMFEQTTHKQKLSAKSVVAFDKMTPKSDVRTPPSTVTAIIGPRKLAGSGNTTAQFYKSRNANNHPSSTCTSGSLGHSQGGKKIECTFAVNKDSTMVQTYRKSNTITPKSPLYTGSFANRLKLIETTPSDEDPYQLREADMREQSPILKLTHRKSSITRTKLFGEDIPSKLNKSIYDFDLGEKDTDLALQKIKLNKYNLGTNYVFPGENDDEASKSDSEKCSDVAKTEPSIWQEIMMNEDKVDESICDFSYDENPQNLSENATFNSANFGTFFSDPFLPQPDDKCDDIFAFVDEQSVTETKKTQATFLSSSYDKYLLDGSTKSTSNSKMSNRSSTDNRPKAFKRKYSNSTETTSMATVTAELPPLMVDVPYYTSVGTDDWWLAGVHPDLMPDGHEPPEMPPAVESLEVPRWRTKQFNSTSTLEGTENLDEKVFKKRHLKQETKERRWKRWDDQQLREQKYVEHLRIRQHEIKKKQFERLQSRQRESQQKQIGRLQSRQRESQQKQTGRLQSRQREAPIENRKQSDDDDSSPVHTFHPQPHLHVQYIELTDAIPLSAFGEAVPAVPECEFALPWIRVSKPFKKCKSASLMKNYNPKIL